MHQPCRPTQRTTAAHPTATWHQLVLVQVASPQRNIQPQHATSSQASAYGRLSLPPPQHTATKPATNAANSHTARHLAGARNHTSLITDQTMQCNAPYITMLPTPRPMMPTAQQASAQQPRHHKPGHACNCVVASRGAGTHARPALQHTSSTPHSCCRTGPHPEGWRCTWHCRHQCSRGHGGWHS